MPFSPIWNDSGVSNQLCMGHEPSPASHTHRCLRAQIWDRNTRGTQGPPCCWNNCAGTSSPGQIQDAPRAAPPSQGRSGQCCWKQSTETQRRSNPEAEGARTGSPVACGPAAPASPPLLPLQSPPAAPAEMLINGFAKHGND